MASITADDGDRPKNLKKSCDQLNQHNQLEKEINKLHERKFN